VAEHLTDEEQLQALKNWWKENGTSILSAILIGLLAYFGWQWWQNSQQQQAEQASAVYSELMDTLQVNNTQEMSDEAKSTAKYLIEQLQNDHGGSQYAINAVLFSAKLAVDDKDLAAAESSLLWVLDRADDKLTYLAQLRLARVYLAQKKFDEALALVQNDPVKEFVSLFAELRGDILVAQQNWSAARIAYQQALDTLGETQGVRRRLLPIKMDNLPEGEG